MTLTDVQLKTIQLIEATGFTLPKIDVKNIMVEKIDAPNTSYLEIVKSDSQLIIRYSHETLFYRGLCVVLPRMLRENQQSAIEETPITEIAYSLDASRNAVMKVASVKKFITYLAMNGFNTLYLYIEDTYTAKNLPYLGYLRGAYTPTEIKEIVAFAKNFDMEVVPAIQTLAHLTQFLKWPASEAIADDANTLLIGEEKSYEAIENMIASVSDSFESKRIHLGMDEAYQAGLGKYLAQHGFKNRTDLMIEHLNRVIDITNRYHFTPLIWSDFVYKLLDTQNSDRLYNPDATISLENAQKLPQGLHYVHWDYGNEDVAKYGRVIDHHLQFCDLDHYMFAGGAHIWNRLAPNHGKTINTIKASIEACKNKGVKAVMLTTWGDDGQETDHWHSLLTAICYTEQIFNTLDLENVKQIFDNLFGAKTFDFMYALRKFDEVDSIPKDNPNMTTISKLVLWQDLLFGLYDFHVSEHDKSATQTLGTYYQNLADELTHYKIVPNEKIFYLMQSRFVLLALALGLKSELGLAIQSARVHEDKEAIRRLLTNQLPKLKNIVEHLQSNHRDIWCTTYKENGWEVLEMRYAGLISRITTTQKKLKKYLDGTDDLSELLEEKLPFCAYDNPIDINGFTYRQTAMTGYN